MPLEATDSMAMMKPLRFTLTSVTVLHVISGNRIEQQALQRASVQNGPVYKPDINVKQSHAEV
jgi:hypothetical protein